MSHSLIKADRGTHIRMVVAAAVSAVVFVGAMAGARMTQDDRMAQGVVKAGGPAIVSSAAPRFAIR